MTIFLDNDYKCHLETDGTMQAADDAFFEDKCRAFIEGYRYLPQGQTWTRDDGEVFTGKMIWPWREFSLLEEFQRQYEEMLAEQEDMRAALELLGVSDEEAPA